MDSRLRREDGVSLTELLVTILVLGLVLGAAVSVFSTSQKAAARDRERNVTIGTAQAAINRIGVDLRQAYQFHMGSDSSCPGGTTYSNCLDFDARGRTTTSGSTVTRAFRRVRWDCFTGNRCVRYVTSGTCVKSSSQNCTAAPALAAPTGSGSRMVTNLQNATVTAPGGTVAPVFDWLDVDGTSMLSAQVPTATFSATPPYAIRITLSVSRKGERRTGLGGNIYLQDGADLKNLTS